MWPCLGASLDPGPWTHRSQTCHRQSKVVLGWPTQEQWSLGEVKLLRVSCLNQGLGPVPSIGTVLCREPFKRMLCMSIAHRRGFLSLPRWPAQGHKLAERPVYHSRKMTCPDTAILLNSVSTPLAAEIWVPLPGSPPCIRYFLIYLTD